ncbi:MAG: DUF819 family protein [Pseudohaliea sp.]
MPEALQADSLVAALLLAVAALGLWVAARPGVRQFGVSAAIAAGALLGGLGLLPGASPVYALINEHFVPLAITLFLLEVNLSRVGREAQPMLKAFLLAVAGVLCGAVLGTVLGLLGENDTAWASIISAGFIGGSANSVAVAGALGLVNDPRFVLVAASVYALVIPYFIALAVLPATGIFARGGHGANGENGEGEEPAPASDDPGPAGQVISELSLARCLLVAMAIVACSDLAAYALGSQAVKYLLLTVLALAVATCVSGGSVRLAGTQPLGQFLIYLFFAAIGAQVDLQLALSEGLAFMLFTATLLLTHAVLLGVLGRLLRVPGRELLIASAACVGGPPLAAGMAGAMRWSDLVTPGLLVGLIGYASANVIGITLAGLLQL